MLIADGRNIVQVSKWLGHHSPDFTLRVYAHLMNGDFGEPLALPAVASTLPARAGTDQCEPLAAAA